VELLDEDVEVNFGPTPGHVTWKGTLFDYDGKPVAEAWIMPYLWDIFPPPGATMLDKLRTLTHRKESSPEGMFEFRKLIPGRYRINIILSGESGVISCGEVTFASPGIHDKDLHLPNPGGKISGKTNRLIKGVGMKGLCTT